MYIFGLGTSYNIKSVTLKRSIIGSQLIQLESFRYCILLGKEQYKNNVCDVQFLNMLRNIVNVLIF